MSDEHLLPPDGGLKPQVRPYDETLSIDDVLETERAKRRLYMTTGQAAEQLRRWQAQDPAHDQPAFKPYHGPFMPSAEGTIEVNGQVYPLSHVRVQYARSVEAAKAVDDILTSLDAPDQPVAVSGTMTANYLDPALLKRLEADEKKWRRFLDRQLYGPVWRRELMWAVHNLFAHPLSEIAHWLGFILPPVRRLGNWFHDITVPPHAPNTGRG